MAVLCEAFSVHPLTEVPQQSCDHPSCFTDEVTGWLALSSTANQRLDPDSNPGNPCQPASFMDTQGRA